MKDEIRKDLDEVIKLAIEDIASMNTGSEEQSRAIEDLVKLLKAKNEGDKLEQDIYALMENNKAQLAEQKKDRYFKYGTEIGLGLSRLALYAIFMIKGFVFEEKGTITSKTFMNLINRFRPTGD